MSSPIFPPTSRQGFRPPVRDGRTGFGLFQAVKTLSQHGFSLMELLVVMGIIALLASIAVPAIIGMGSAGGAKQAGAVISDMASLARQDAISKNVPTAIVTSPMVGASQTNWYVAVVGMTANNSWSQLEKWTALPQGMIVADTSTPPNSLPSPPASLTNSRFTFRGATNISPGATNPTYVFYPDGHMLAGTTIPKVRVQFQTGGGGTNNWYELVFNTATGTYKINRP